MVSKDPKRACIQIKEPGAHQETVQKKKIHTFPYPQLSFCQEMEWNHTDAQSKFLQ